ncbi:MAG TPA: ABC transporter ATP-binding protein [Salinisphaeraceae bacterium]|nr:ABC transporter ATP-binding protein [Salinisphaeraceae bacterium]
MSTNNGHYFECRDLHAYYGESYILQGVSFHLEHNEILALLGRNGAGKTTTLRTIARAKEPRLRQGEIHLQGKPVHPLRTHMAARAGISLVPEDRRIIPGLTVEQNLTLAQVAPSKGWTLERIYQQFPRLGERRKQQGITLSGGEQQMLAIARALARDLSLLLLDEPYEGLAPKIVAEIEQALVTLKQEGLTIILVEQNAIAALDIADRAAILDDGQIVYEGNPDEVLSNEHLRRDYLAL